MCFKSRKWRYWPTTTINFFKLLTPLHPAQGTHFWVLNTQGRKNLKLSLTQLISIWIQTLRYTLLDIGGSLKKLTMVVGRSAEIKFLQLRAHDRNSKMLDNWTKILKFYIQVFLHPKEHRVDWDIPSLKKLKEKHQNRDSCSCRQRIIIKIRMNNPIINIQPNTSTAQEWYICTGDQHKVL